MNEFVEEPSYKCTYKVYWSEQSKLEGQKRLIASSSDFLSFSYAYLLKIHFLLKEFENGKDKLYPWAVGKFNLSINPKSTNWGDISLLGHYHSFSFSDEAQTWCVVVNTLLFISDRLPELVIR